MLGITRLNKEIIGAIPFVMEHKQCKEKIVTVSKVSDISSSESGINLLHAGCCRAFLHALSTELARRELVCLRWMYLWKGCSQQQLCCVADNVVFHVGRKR